MDFMTEDISKVVKYKEKLSNIELKLYTHFKYKFEIDGALSHDSIIRLAMKKAVELFSTFGNDARYFYDFKLY